MNLYKVIDFLDDQSDNINRFGLYVFVLFFAFQGIHIYDLTVENDQIEEIIEKQVVKVEESNIKILSNGSEVLKILISKRDNFDRAKPYLRLLESFQIGKGNLKEFLVQIREDLKINEIRGFEDGTFFMGNPIMESSLSFPMLENLALVEAQNEFLLRLNMNLFNSSVLLCGPLVFTRVETQGDKYHFYPNNFEAGNSNTVIKINGDIITKDDYLWKPTRRGMHYFDIEYIDHSNYRLHKKQFRVGLKVV